MSGEIRHSTKHSNAAWSEQVFRNPGVTTWTWNPKIWKRGVCCPFSGGQFLGNVSTPFLRILCIWAADTNGSRCSSFSHSLCKCKKVSVSVRSSDQNGTVSPLSLQSLTALFSIQLKTWGAKQVLESLGLSFWSFLSLHILVWFLPCFCCFLFLNIF